MKYLYTIWGKVIRGKNRGKKLGFPTVNIRLHKKIPEGVYISETKIGKEVFKSVSFIGAAKTFNEKKIYGESYIFNFNRGLYDVWISIKLLKKLRSNKKFASASELIEQIKKDKSEAMEYFKI